MKMRTLLNWRHWIAKPGKSSHRDLDKTMQTEIYGSKVPDYKWRDVTRSTSEQEWSQYENLSFTWKYYIQQQDRVYMLIL